MENRMKAALKAVELVDILLTHDTEIGFGVTQRYFDLTRQNFPEIGEKLTDLWQKYLERKRLEDAQRPNNPAGNIVDVSRLFSDTEYKPFPERQAEAVANEPVSEQETTSDAPAKMTQAKHPDELKAFFASTQELREFMGTVLGKEISSKTGLVQLYKIFTDNLSKFETYLSLKENQ